MLRIPTDGRSLRPGIGKWVHLAFVYSSKSHRIRHFLNGRLQRSSSACDIRALPHGDAAYFTVARDGAWGDPLQGRIDELRFSSGEVYLKNFTPPESFAPIPPTTTLPNHKPLPLLFANHGPSDTPVDLGSRKYVFIDGSILEHSENIRFAVNPPKQEELVMEWTPNLTKHISVLEDATGLIHLYYEGPDDSLAVATSKDGIHFTLPDLGHGTYQGQENIVVTDKAILGNVFLIPQPHPTPAISL